jgi:hypothetical protein
MKIGAPKLFLALVGPGDPDEPCTGQFLAVPVFANMLWFADTRGDTSMVSNVSSQDAGSPNRRPDNVLRLMHQGDGYPHWAHNNQHKKRFFLTNFASIITQYRAVVGRRDDLKQYLEKAATEISANNPEWNLEYPGIYLAGNTQISDSRIKEGKWFDFAASIIVAMELAFKDKGIPVNVYDYLRIVPAFYFINAFDSGKLAAIKSAYAAMSNDEKLARFGKFGAGADHKSFYQICFAAVGQTEDGSVVDGLAKGYLATKYVCDGLVQLINENFDPSCHVGEALGAGQDGSNGVLGTLGLAPGLKVRQAVLTTEFEPCN